MILSEMYNELAERCALDPSDTTNQSKMRTALNEAQNEILSRADFAFALRIPVSPIITTVSGVATYTLPPDFHKGLFLRQVSSPAFMKEENPTKFYEENPNPTTTGEPDTFILNGLIWVAAQPTSDSTISVVSASASDTTQKVVIRGISSGVDMAEELTLNGTTPVTSSNSYSYLTSITKENTNGTVTATSNNGTVTNISLLPNENFNEYWEVRLHPIPDGTYSIYGGYYRKPWRLYYTTDIPIIPDEHIEVLLAKATAILLFKQGDQKFTFWEQKAENCLALLMDANDWISQSKDERYEIKA